MTESPLLNVLTVSTVTTTSNVTYTPAQVMGGLILRDPNGADRADKVPLATDLAAAFGTDVVAGFTAGQAFEFTVRNTADAVETITLTANTGITTSGTMTIAQNNSKRFLLVMSSATAGVVYRSGRSSHERSRLWECAVARRDDGHCLTDAG